MLGVVMTNQVMMMRKHTVLNDKTRTSTQFTTTRTTDRATLSQSTPYNVVIIQTYHLPQIKSFAPSGGEFFFQIQSFNNVAEYLTTN